MNFSKYQAHPKQSEKSFSGVPWLQAQLSQSEKEKKNIKTEAVLIKKQKQKTKRHKQTQVYHKFAMVYKAYSMIILNIHLFKAIAHIQIYKFSSFLKIIGDNNDLLKQYYSYLLIFLQFYF